MFLHIYNKKVDTCVVDMCIKVCRIVMVSVNRKKAQMAPFRRKGGIFLSSYLYYNEFGFCFYNVYHRIHVWEDSANFCKSPDKSL